MTSVHMRNDVNRCGVCRKKIDKKNVPRKLGGTPKQQIIIPWTYFRIWMTRHAYNLRITRLQGSLYCLKRCNPLSLPYKYIVFSKMAESLGWFNLKITPLLAYWTNPTASTDLPHSVIACFVCTKIAALLPPVQQQFWLIVVIFIVKLIYIIFYKALIINIVQLNSVLICEKNDFFFFFF